MKNRIKNLLFFIIFLSRVNVSESWESRACDLQNCNLFIIFGHDETDTIMFILEGIGWLMMMVVALAVVGCLLVAFVVFGLSFAALLGSVIGALGYWIGRFFKRIFAPEKKKSHRTSSPDNATSSLL